MAQFEIRTGAPTMRWKYEFKYGNQWHTSKSTYDTREQARQAEEKKRAELKKEAIRNKLRKIRIIELFK